MDSIEARLTDWGLWASGYQGSGCGGNPIAMMVSRGTIVQASPDNWSQFPPLIEQTDRAIAQLGLRHKYLKRLVFSHYLYQHQPEEIATLFNRPVDNIHRSLDCARDWIGDYLDSLEDSAKLSNVSGRNHP